MEIDTTYDIDAPAQAAWEVFGEKFGDIADWSSAIEASSLGGALEEGVMRTCHIKAVGPIAAGVITEELTEFDRGSRTVAYSVLTGTPGFIRQLDNHWTFESIEGDRTRVRSTLTLQVAWWMVPMSPVLRFQMARSVRDFIAQFARHVEASWG